MSLREDLAKFELFEGFNSDELDTVANVSRQRELEADTLLFQEGEPARNLYLVESGDVLIEIETATGKNLPIQRLSSRDVLGWSWLVPPKEWKFDARTVDEARVLEVDGQELESVFESNLELGNRFKDRLIEMLAERVTQIRYKLLDIYQTTVEFEELTGG